jgi:acetyl esterase/lipase
MAIFYLAESPLVPDLGSDYYLSPMLSPAALLAQFPRTYMLCGEKDPLVDDTIVFMNRIKAAQTQARKDLDPSLDIQISDPDSMKIKILPGLSHGFFQCYSFLPGFCD